MSGRSQLYFDSGRHGQMVHPLRTWLDQAVTGLRPEHDVTLELRYRLAGALRATGAVAEAGEQAAAGVAEKERLGTSRVLLKAWVLHAEMLHSRGRQWKVRWAMPWRAELENLIGEGRVGLDVDSWQRAATVLRCDLPDDVKELLSAFGGVQVCQFLTIFDVGEMIEYHAEMRELLSANPLIDDEFLPDSGGALIWGNTVEGDQLLLLQRQGGWVVGAWSSQWAEFYESTQGICDWLPMALSERNDVPFLPEWTYPLDVSRIASRVCGLPLTGLMARVSA